MSDLILPAWPKAASVGKRPYFRFRPVVHMMVCGHIKAVDSDVLVEMTRLRLLSPLNKTTHMPTAVLLDLKPLIKPLTVPNTAAGDAIYLSDAIDAVLGADGVVTLAEMHPHITLTGVDLFLVAVGAIMPNSDGVETGTYQLTPAGKFAMNELLDGVVRII